MFDRAMFAVVVATLAGAPVAARGPSWKPVGPDGAYLVDFTSAPQDAATLYSIVSSDPGLYRSTNHGEHWTRLAAPAGDLEHAAQVVVLPDPSATILVARAISNKVARSTDGGATWSVTAAGAGSDPRVLVADPLVAGRVFLGSRFLAEPGIFRSDDGGASWVHADAGVTGDVWDVACHPAQPDVLLALTYDGIFRSTSAGTSWTLVDSATPWSNIAWSAADPTRVYVGGWRSDDAGQTFVPMPPVDPEWSVRRITGVDPTNADHIFFIEDFLIDTWNWTYESHLFESFDAGATWLPHFVSPHDPIRLEFDPLSSERIYYLSGGANPRSLLRSEDGGTTWAAALGGIRALPIRHVVTDGAGVVYARVDHGRYRTTDLGETWSQVFGYLQPGVETFVLNRATGTVFEAGGYFALDTGVGWIARSTDQGETWTDVRPSLQYCLIESYSLVTTSEGTGSAVYLWEGTCGLLYRSFDGGDVFEFVADHAAPAAAVIHPLDDHTLYVLGSGGLVERSTDGGESFEPLSAGLPGGEGRALFLDPAAPDVLVAAYGNGDVWRSETAGAEWEHWLTVPGGDVVAADWDPERDHFMAVGEGAGFYSSLFGIWNHGLPSLKPTALCYVPSHDAILLGTNEASLFALDGSFVKATTMPAPSPRSTLQAAPNPFQNEIVATADSPIQEVTVYDVQGRLLRRLHADPSAPSVRWDGRSGSGVPVPAGVYFLRVRLADRDITEKIVRLSR